MKKRLLSLVAIALFVSSAAVAQKNIIVQKAATVPTIDGDVSDWADVTPYPIAVAFKEEAVSWEDDGPIAQVSDATVATVKMVWNDTAVFVLVEVPDDEFYPFGKSGGNSWEADKPEVYFDVNEMLIDGGGPSDDAGHYQITSGVDADEMPEAPAAGVAVYGYYDKDYADATSYAVEYSVPMAFLMTNEDAMWDVMAQPVIGFDVTIIDVDEANLADGNQRVNFSNNGIDGPADESWNNMDNCGIASFEEMTSYKGNVARTNVLMTNLVVTGELEINVDFTDVKVMNTVGQVVATSTNVSNLTNGVYIVAVTTTEGQVVANRFVKK